MSRFNLILGDCPWSFSDPLTMSDTKRGAASQYDVLTTKDIIKLDVELIAADDAVLVLWVPSSLLQEGLDTMKSWGFKQTQTFIWVKTKKKPLIELTKEVKKLLKTESGTKLVPSIINNFNLNKVLNFFMGRLFRQTHEIALVGKRGKPYGSLENKSQRSVIVSETDVVFDPNFKHSEKPEGLQDRLDIMFPDAKKVELFARRQRPGWLCLGNEMPGKEDIRDSIKRIKEEKE